MNLVGDYMTCDIYKSVTRVYDVHDMCQDTANKVSFFSLYEDNFANPTLKHKLRTEKVRESDEINVTLKYI